MPTILEKIRAMSIAKRTAISEVVKLIKLLLLAPATNAESERIFSGLKRVKTYLRSTMGSGRLNHLMFLHIHKEKCDEIDLIDTANRFVARNAARANVFGRFSLNDLKSTRKTKTTATQTIAS